MDEWLVDVESPVSGTVIQIHRGAGQEVEADDPVATIEAEGLHVAVNAGQVGVVEEVRADVGVYVEPGDVLAVVATSTEPNDARQDDLQDAPPEPQPVKCTQCGNGELRRGFLEDQGGSSGYGRWIEGPLELGMLGAARRMGKRRYEIEASRCSRCGHLELFAIDPGP